MTGIITQARINSTRLPNKILRQAAGHSFFHYHIQRLIKTGLPVFVATTNDGSEQPIVDFCKQNNLPCFCGDEQNVLLRFYNCAKEHSLTTIIRVTSDCPLIDGDIIAKGLAAYKNLRNQNVYYSNAIVRTYPRGMDYEIFSFDLLQNAFVNATDNSDKEHVTPYIWKNKSGNVVIVDDVNEENNSTFRITLDTIEDQLLITKLIEQYNAAALNCSDIVTVLKNNPQLAAINQMIEQKKV